MPIAITIFIDEHIEAKVMALVDQRQSFRLEGGLVRDSADDPAYLAGITFQFVDTFDGTPQITGVFAIGENGKTVTA